MNELPLRQIIQGDCIEIMKDFRPKSIDLCLTDPPYGVRLDYGDYYHDSPSNWGDLFLKIMPELLRVAKMIIMPCCQIRRLRFIYQNYPPDWLICWYKGSPGHCALIGFNDWEPMLVYGKNDKVLMHDYFQTITQEPMGNYGHPCPKPLEWAEWLISHATREGDIVLDPFLGSGTTAVACEKLRRKWIGIEINPEYCEIARKRVQPWMSQIRLDGVENQID